MTGVISFYFHCDVKYLMSVVTFWAPNHPSSLNAYKIFSHLLFWAYPNFFSLRYIILTWYSPKIESTKCGYEPPGFSSQWRYNNDRNHIFWTTRWGRSSCQFLAKLEKLLWVHSNFSAKNECFTPKKAQWCHNDVTIVAEKNE